MTQESKRPYSIDCSVCGHLYSRKHLDKAVKVALFQSGKHRNGVTTITYTPTGEEVLRIEGLCAYTSGLHPEPCVNK